MFYIDKSTERLLQQCGKTRKDRRSKKTNENAEYEDENENTTEHVAHILNLTTPTVRHRTHVLGIYPEVKGRKFLYSESQIERIKNYQRKKYFSNKVELKTRFAVIELYLTIKENSVKNISQATGISISTVTYVLTDYFKNNKSIVVESKMNQL